MVCSCVFEFLCWVVWEVESWNSWCAQVLAWRLFSQRSWPEAMSQYHMFDSYFWFVWLVCWSVCSVMSSSNTPLSQSDVTRSSLFLLSVQSSQCGSAKCNRASASCCSCLFNQVLWRRRSKLNCVGVGVSTKWNRVSCHVGTHQETHVSSSVRVLWRLNNFAGLVWVCCAWSVCALLLGEMVWERSQFCFQAAFPLALWLFFRKFFTLSYFSRSRFVHVSDALRSLHVRLFQFRRQWWFHPTPFLGEPRDEVISGSSLWDVLCVSNLKLTSAGASRSVCLTSCSPVQAHHRVVIAAQFCESRLGNVLGKLPFVSSRFCRSWRRCFPTTTDHANFVKCKWCVRVCLNFLCWVVCEVESCSSWKTQILAWRLFSQRSWPEAMSQCHIFDSCFWFVWLVCWSVCCVTGDVAEWRDEIFFGSSLCAVFKVWEWQMQQSVCQLLFVFVQSSVVTEAQ